MTTCFIYSLVREVGIRIKEEEKEDKEEQEEKEGREEIRGGKIHDKGTSSTDADNLITFKNQYTSKFKMIQ